MGSDRESCFFTLRVPNYVRIAIDDTELSDFVGEC